MANKEARGAVLIFIEDAQEVFSRAWHNGEIVEWSTTRALISVRLHVRSMVGGRSRESARLVGESLIFGGASGRTEAEDLLLKMEGANS